VSSVHSQSDTGSTIYAFVRACAARSICANWDSRLVWRVPSRRVNERDVTKTTTIGRSRIAANIARLPELVSKS
jgi:hypothetical protein